MKKEAVILIAENDDEHFSLMHKNLECAGLYNEILRFTDGRETLDFLLMKGHGPKRQHKKEYLLLLDIRIPKIDGVEVLEKIKQDTELKKIPVIILTTTDRPDEIELCHCLGCGIYIVKPTEHESFEEAIRKVGVFLSTVSVPQINGE